MHLGGVDHRPDEVGAPSSSDIDATSSRGRRFAEHNTRRPHGRAVGIRSHATTWRPKSRSAGLRRGWSAWRFVLPGGTPCAGRKSLVCRALQPETAHCRQERRVFGQTLATASERTRRSSSSGSGVGFAAPGRRAQCVLSAGGRRRRSWASSWTPNASRRRTAAGSSRSRRTTSISGRQLARRGVDIEALTRAGDGLPGVGALVGRGHGRHAVRALPRPRRAPQRLREAGGLRGRLQARARRPPASRCTSRGTSRRARPSCGPSPRRAGSSSTR